MKKIKFLAAFLVMLSAIGFTSCESEPVDPVLIGNEGNTPGPAVFTVDFGGETYTATSSAAVAADGTITIAGLRGTSGEVVTIVVDGTTTGTYNDALMSYTPTGASEFSYVNFDPSEEGEPNLTGSVHITSIDTENHTISGTFSFTGHYQDTEANLPNISFTNGSFEDIPYTGNIGTNPGPGPVGEEYFKAKVDGTMVDFPVTMSMSSGGTMVISGSTMGGKGIQLSMNSNVAPGTYTIEEFGDATATYTEVSGIGVTGSEGTLTIISKANGWIKGTFSFSGEDMEGNQHEITEGEFNMEY